MLTGQTTTRNRPPSRAYHFHSHRMIIRNISTPSEQDKCARRIMAGCCPSRSACLADIQLACSSAACKKSFFSERRILANASSHIVDETTFLVQ